MFSPFMKDRDELGLAPAFEGIRASRELEEFWGIIPGASPETLWSGGSSPTNRDLRLNMWTVPLSLETASHFTDGERDILYISALSTPLLTYIFIIIERKKKYNNTVNKHNERKNQ